MTYNIEDFMGLDHNHIPSVSGVLMKDIYSKAVGNIIDNLQKSIDNIRTNAKVLPLWSKPEPFKESLSGASKATGVYKIFHRNRDTGDLKLMSIGWGNIGTRKARHKSVFLNDGKTVISEKTSSASGSQTAMKMHNHDPNLDNWYFSWCDVGNRELSHEYESVLIHQLKPEFNNLSMAGR